jgi:hypothetical protein
MHPVMAFPAALFVFFFGFRGRQQLLLGLAGLATVAMLVQRGIPPFGGLTHKVDPLWLGLLIERSPILFLDQWPGAAYREPIFYLVLLTTAALVAAPGEPPPVVVCYRRIALRRRTGFARNFMAWRSAPANAALASVVAG